jgi:hypothetical protein
MAERSHAGTPALRPAAAQCPRMSHGANQIFISYRRDDAAGYAGRLEEAVAPESGARVMPVPVLLPGATMPAATDLPEPLKPLAQRNALSLNDVLWDADMERRLPGCWPKVAARRAWHRCASS